MIHSPLEVIIQAIHSLSAAAWFGALVYRTFFVDPKASRYFHEGADYERFSLNLAHGMRHVVLLALATCGLSGFVLMGLRWDESTSWLALISAKTALWLLAAMLFAYISWVYWPQRVFATATEWSGIRRQGLALSIVMIGIASVGFVLGQMGQAFRNEAVSIRSAALHVTGHEVLPLNATRSFTVCGAGWLAREGVSWEARRCGPYRGRANGLTLVTGGRSNAPTAG